MDISEKDELVFKSLGIRALILFGSHAQGVANEVSDYDFFVIGKKAENSYDAIYNILSSKINKLTDIDIVFEGDASGELKSHVAKHGTVLYQESGSVFADFKQRVMLEYSDFASLRAIFSDATMARIG